MKQLTPILLSVLIAVCLGVNGWWAVQWGETNRAVMANQLAIARMGRVVEIAMSNQLAIAKIESTRFTEADGARSLLEVWAAIASLKQQVADLQMRRP